MTRIFGSFLDIRRGEATLTLLMFFYYYFILLAYYCLKPARDSLFLTRLGSDQLPFVYILIALIVVPVTTLYARWADSLNLKRLLVITTLTLIASFGLLRLLIQIDHPWVYYVFYIWVSIYAILATSQFWLFANEVFNPTQAKRLFPLLNLGGIIGAMTGGEVTSLIVQVFGVPTENLLFFCIAFLAVCVLLVNLTWRARQKEGGVDAVHALRREGQRETIGQLFGTVRRSRQLMFILGIISMTMMVATFVDFQFKAVSVAAFPAQEDLTAFLGRFYGRLSLVSLLFQSLFAYRFLRILGVGGVIFFLPISLLFGSLALLVAPGLWAGILLKGAEGSFRYSIDKTGRELLFLPIPPQVKRRTKVFIDVFIDRLFRGVAGVFLLILTLMLGWPVTQVSIVVICLLAIWIFFATRVRKEYVNAFRKALERREIDPNELRTDITDASTIDSLVETLKSTNERLVTYALDMLAPVKEVELIPSLRPLLNHPSAEVRRKAIQLLQTQANGTLVPEMEHLLEDEDYQVRLEAIYFLCRHDPDNHLTRLRTYLKHHDARIQMAAVGCVVEHGETEDKALIDEKVIRSLITRKGRAGETSRVQAAKALGVLNQSTLRPYLLQLMDDPSPVVVRQVIEAVGQSKDHQFVPWLLGKLSDRRYRVDARLALASFGTRILGTLADHLTDKTVDLRLRMNIPRVFAQIRHQQSVDILTAIIGQLEPAVKYRAVKALNKLRSQYRQLRFDEEKVNTTLIEETKSYYEILQILHVQHGLEDRPPTQLLKTALSV